MLPFPKILNLETVGATHAPVGPDVAYFQKRKEESYLPPEYDTTGA